MDPIIGAAALLLFVAVFLAIEGSYLWWRSTRSRSARRVSGRLAAVDEPGDGVETTGLLRAGRFGAVPWLEAWLGRVSIYDRAVGLIAQSGVPWSPVVPVVASALGLLCVGPTVAWLSGSGRIGLAAGALCAAAPWGYLVSRRARRIARIEVLLPDALDMLARSMRAGHSFNNAMRLVADEMPDPIGAEFRRTVDEIAFGVALPDALMALAARTPSADMRYFVIASQIQRETGGNLTEVLTKIAELVRARLRLRGHIDTLTTEGRSSATILLLLPFGTAALMFAVDRQFVSVLWTEPLGLKLLYGMGFMMTLGVLWMRKLVRIRI
jgi:tight adherence protein B